MLRTEKKKEPGEGVELDFNMEIFLHGYRWGRYKDTKKKTIFTSNLNQCELKWRDHVNSPHMHKWGSNQPAGGSNTTNWTCSGALCRGRARAPAVVEGEPRSDKAEEQVGEGSSRSTLAWGEADREPACKVFRGGARPNKWDDKGWQLLREGRPLGFDFQCPSHCTAHCVLCAVR